jgi:hypothetical protein
MALDWAAETVRLSLFFSDAVKSSNADWKRVTGQEEPETTQTVAARRTMIGPFQGGVLNMTSVGPRIDCILLPRAPTETVEEGYVPTIGALAPVCADFVKATSGFVAAFVKPILRVAFAGTTMARCENPQEAYSQLLGLLKSVKGDPAKMRELVFRINWPVNSRTLKDLTLNRITSWAVLQIQLQLMVQTGTKTVVSETPATHVIRMEFDENTDAERSEPFDPTTLVPIYEELEQISLGLNRRDSQRPANEGVSCP